MNFVSKLFGLVLLGLTAQCGSTLASGWSIDAIGPDNSGSSFASSANGINNQEQIIGLAAFSSGVSPRPVLWSNGQQVDLGLASGGYALSINNQGQIVGWFNAGTNALPFIWNGGSSTQLPLLTGGTEGKAESINNSGLIVGSANFPWQGSSYFDSTAVLWQGATLTPLDSYDAIAINDAGQVLLVDSNPGSLPSLLTGGSLVPIATGGDPDLFGSIQALAMNNQAQVVGYYSADLMHAAPWQAFVWDNEVFTALPGFPSAPETHASAINNLGQIVGYSFNGPDNQRAVLWEDGEMTDLSLLPEALAQGWVLTEATAINDWGQIVGNGYLNGVMRAFLLTPPPRLMFARDGNALVLNWRDPAYSLQVASAVGNTWSTLSVTPPVRIPFSSGQAFFRLVKSN